MVADFLKSATTFFVGIGVIQWAMSTREIQKNANSYATYINKADICVNTKIDRPYR